MLAFSLSNCQQEKTKNNQKVDETDKNEPKGSVLITNTSSTCKITDIRFVYQNARRNENGETIDMMHNPDFIALPNETVDVGVPHEGLYKAIECYCLCGGKKRLKTIKKGDFELYGNENLKFSVNCDR